MTKPIEDIDDARTVRALAHPLRVRIMGLLERRTMSPKELSGALGVPLEAGHVILSGSFIKAIRFGPGARASVSKRR